MPFGPDCQYEDHADCVAQNADAEDADALCAQLERDTADACMAEDGEDTSDDDGVDDDMAAVGQRWQGPVGIEGEDTGDGRSWARNSIYWDNGPWAVIWDRQDGDHTGVVVGHADRIWRDGDLIMAEGALSASQDPETQAAVQRVTELLTPVDGGTLPAVGVSVALDSEEVEIRVNADLLERTEEEGAEPVMVADGGSAEDHAASWLVDQLDDGPKGAAVLVREAKAAGHAERTLRRAKATLGVESAKAADGRWAWQLAANLEDDGEDEPDEDGRIVVAKYRANDEVMVVTSARIRHIAIVDTPAFADARISLVAAIAASIDLDAFGDPRFGMDGDTDTRLARQEPERSGESVAWGAPLTVTDDGRVFGHAALWGRCHAGFSDRCTVAPRGGSYGRFLSGSAIPGVATGPITVGTTHAQLSASPGEAMRHYSDTGRAVADVAVGEDEHGIWVAGRLRDGVSDADVAALRGSSLSGDWRWIGGGLRLVGLLAVNQPGFLVQRELAAGLDGYGNASVTFGPCNCDGLTAAAHGEFTGAVISVWPTDADAARLAVDGYEPPDELHVTLAWLGEAADVDDDTRAQVLEAAEAIADATSVFTGDAFAHAVFNPTDDGDREPASVLLVQAAELAQLRSQVEGLDASEFPVFFPHVTVGYNVDGDVDLAGLVGDVSFDRLAVSFGSDDVNVFPLASDGAADDDDAPEPDEAEDDEMAVATAVDTTADGTVRYVTHERVADGWSEPLEALTGEVADLKELVADLLRRDLANH